MRSRCDVDNYSHLSITFDSACGQSRFLELPVSHHSQLTKQWQTAFVSFIVMVLDGDEFKSIFLDNIFESKVVTKDDDAQVGLACRRCCSVRLLAGGAPHAHGLPR